MRQESELWPGYATGRIIIKKDHDRSEKDRMVSVRGASCLKARVTVTGNQEMMDWSTRSTRLKFGEVYESQIKS